MKLANKTKKGIMTIKGYDDPNGKIPQWTSIEPGETIELEDELMVIGIRAGLTPDGVSIGPPKEEKKEIDVGPPKIQQIPKPKQPKTSAKKRLNPKKLGGKR